MKRLVLLTLVLLPLVAVAQHEPLTKRQSRQHIEALGRIARQGYSVREYLAGDNLAIVVKDKRYGAIDLKGNVVIPLEYDWLASQRQNKMLLAEKDTLAGFLDRKGKAVIPVVYDYYFVEWETQQYFSEGMIPVSRGGKSGIVDTNGRIVVPFIHDNTSYCIHKQRFIVSNYDKKNGYRQWLVSLNGDTVAGPYNRIDYYNDAPYLVANNDLYGYIGEDGREIIPCRYEKASYFRDGIAAVQEDGRWRIVDEALRTVVPSSRLPREGRLGWVTPERNRLLVCDDGNNCAVVDNSGRTIIPFSSKYVFDCTDDRIALSGGEYDSLYIYDTAGHLLETYDGSDIHEIDEGFYYSPVVCVSRDSLFGFVDHRWRTVVPCKYTNYLWYVDNGYFFYKDDEGSLCMMDTLGHSYFKGPYSHANYQGDGIFMVGSYSPKNYNEDIFGFVDIYGNTTFTDGEMETLYQWRQQRLKENRTYVPAPTIQTSQNAPAQVSDNDDEVIFVVVEEAPRFPGGDSAMYMYLCMNLSYPDKARENGIEGVVIVSFTIEKDGSVSHVRVLRDIGGGCGEAAVEVVKAMPRWEPGRQSGKAVRTLFNLPLRFQLSEKDDPENSMAQEEKCLYGFQHSGYKK